MKFQFSNGHSISLWSEEFSGIEINETRFTYIRPNGKKVHVSLPQKWLDGCPKEKISGLDAQICATLSTLSSEMNEYETASQNKVQTQGCHACYEAHC